MLKSTGGVFRDRLSNDVNQILQRPTLVAMATKVKTKQKKTDSARIKKISRCRLRLLGGIRGWAIE